MLKSKTVLLTGATDDIGKQAALRLAQQGAVLLMHGKNPEKGEKLRQKIINDTQNAEVYYFNADFTSFADIAKLSDVIHEKFSHLDVLVNNAGIFEHKKIILKNGLEKNFMVNYLAGFVLTIKLLDLLKKSTGASVMNVSSMIHAQSIDFDNLNAEKHYLGDGAYSLSKLCNILFTYELSEMLRTNNITVNAMHPGVINTKLLRAGWGNFGSNAEEGAAGILYLTASPDVTNVTGKYFMNDKPVKSADISYY